MEERERKIAAAALLIVAGGIVGAGMALLFAPQSGKRTRKDIFRYSKKIRNRADETADDLASQVTGLVESIANKTEDLLGRSKDIAGSTRKELIRLIEEGAADLEKFRTILSRMK